MAEMEMTERVGKDHGKKDYRNSDKAGVWIAFPHLPQTWRLRGLDPESVQGVIQAL